MTSTRLTYQPALDGLRGIAVTMVLLFHGELSWMRGGYFGVSIFFTLSGFLITSLLVREYEATDRIAPKAFYARRLRRLLPASVVCLAAVCVLGAFKVWKGAVHLRRDALGAMFQVANWVQLFSGGSYTDLQTRQAGLVSPLEHYWSLAIEEQFYWIWPLVFWGLARLARRRRWTLSSVLAVLTLCCAVAAPLVAVVWGRDAAYWATPGRAGEILIGAWLAVAVANRALQPRRWMAPTAAIVVLGFAVALPAAGGPAYHGAFPLLAVATTVLLLGLQRPGPVASALSTRPLVALGKVSYGVYLYHFPIFLLMTPDRVGESGTRLLALRIATTVVVAVMSYWLIERPIRFGQLSGARTAIWSGFATAGVCGLVLVIPVAQSANYFVANADLAAAAGIKPIVHPVPLVVTRVAVDPTNLPTSEPVTPLPDTTSSSPAVSGPPATTEEPVDPTTAPAATTIPVLSRPARILVVGDSTAEATGAGMISWAAEHPELAQVSLDVSPGCGFIRGGGFPSDTNFATTCDRLLDHSLPGDLVHMQPDVVMLMVTLRDLEPKKWNDDEGLIGPLDPRYAARARRGYQAITDLILSTTTARIVWILPPNVDPYWMGGPYIGSELLDVRDHLIEDTVAANSDRSEALDLGAWMEADGVANDHDARPDGLHLTGVAARYVTDQWLGPQLLAAAAENAGVEASTTTTSG